MSANFYEKTFRFRSEYTFDIVLNSFFGVPVTLSVIPNFVLNTSHYFLSSSIINNFFDSFKNFLSCILIFYKFLLPYLSDYHG